MRRFEAENLSNPVKVYTHWATPPLFSLAERGVRFKGTYAKPLTLRVNLEADRHCHPSHVVQ
ncbi:MAG: hypothetical protein ACI8VW_004115 [bacterium]